MVVQFVLEQRQIVIEVNRLLAHQLEDVQLDVGRLHATLVVQRALVVGAERPVVRPDFLLQLVFGSRSLPLFGARHLNGVQLVADLLDAAQRVQRVEVDLGAGRVVGEGESVLGEHHFGEVRQVQGALVAVINTK